MFQVQQLQGVYSLQEQHFWTLCSDVYVGTLKLIVAPDADARWILSQTHNIFTQVWLVTNLLRVLRFSASASCKNPMFNMSNIDATEGKEQETLLSNLSQHLESL